LPVFQQFTLLLISLGIVFSTASELRVSVASQSVGGEILILLGLLLNISPGVRNMKEPEAEQVERLGVICMGGLMLIMIPGYLITVTSMRHLVWLSNHNYIAYGFIFVVFCLCKISRLDLSAYKRVLYQVAAIQTVLCLVYVAMIGLNRDSLFGVSLYFYNRFKGLSENPNQFAFGLVAIPFILANAFGEGGVVRKLVCGASIFVVGLAGLLTRTDTLIFCYLLGLVGLAVAMTAFGHTNARLLWGVLLAVGLVASVLNQDRIYDAYEALARKDRDQLSVRVRLWSNGLRAFSVSPLIGHGSANFSGDYQPFEGKEAHNSLIDLLASCGILGLGLFAYCVGGIVRGLWIRQSIYALAVVTSLFVFMMMHYVLRHPFFWLILTFSTALTCATPRRNAPSLHSHA